MAIECPLSCGICTHSCNDTDTSCGAWATAGECEENPDSMLRLCPTSCGLCTPECKDIDKECPGWGAAGECNTNPEFMIRTCPVTCEACKATCKDIQPDCPGWTADGECFKNPGFMCATPPPPPPRTPPPPSPHAACVYSCPPPYRRYKECPNSCGVCEGVKCADKNSTQCEIWADAGECVNNPLAVMKECPDSCGVRRAAPSAAQRRRAAAPLRRLAAASPGSHQAQAERDRPRGAGLHDGVQRPRRELQGVDQGRRVRDQQGLHASRVPVRRGPPRARWRTLQPRCTPPLPARPPHPTPAPRLAPGRSSCGVCQILESVGDKDEL